MASSRNIEEELADLRDSLRTPKSGLDALELDFEWLKKEFQHAFPTKLYDKVDKWRDQAQHVVSSHPIAAAAAAFCIGFVMGRAWSRHDGQ